MPAASDDAEFQARFGAFLQGLGQLGRRIGQNVRIDTRWASGNAAEIRRHAAELVALAPEVILADGAGRWGRGLGVYAFAQRFNVRFEPNPSVFAFLPN